MQAIMKKDNKIIINGADSSERILLENLVAQSKDENKKIVLENILDINGDVNGILIALTDIPKESTEELPVEESPVEDSSPTIKPTPSEV